MTCDLLLSLITPPVTYIFGIVFIFIAFIAASGNTIALMILWQPQMRSQSNKMLTSLVLADALVGYVQLPLSAWQLLKQITSSNSCTLEGIRAFFIVSLTGASCSAISLIAYDRYILLTKLNNYYSYMTSRKVNIMIAMSWIIPMLSVLLRFINLYSYLFLIFFLAFGPLLVMLISYSFIAKKIHKNEKEFRKMPGNHVFPEKILEQRRTNMAKMATLLIVCYFICSLPTSAWLILYTINIFNPFLTEYTFEILYLSGLVTFSINSCINPIIYAWKYPEFRTSFKKLITMRKSRTISTISVISRKGTGF